MLGVTEVDEVSQVLGRRSEFGRRILKFITIGSCEYTLNMDSSFDFSLSSMFLLNPIYKNAPPKSQHTLLKDPKQKEFTISFDAALFPPKPTKERYCRKKITDGYYKCKDCEGENNACVCKDCFDFERHKEHNFTIVSAGGYCDCGIARRWNAEGFCKDHGAHAEQEVAISQQQRRDFLQFYMGCFSIYFELHNQSICTRKEDKQAESYQLLRKGANSYLKELFSHLAGLNKNSPFYNQLTTELLLSKMAVNCKEDKTAVKQTNTILALLLNISGETLPNQFANVIVGLADTDIILEEFYKDYWMEATRNEVRGNSAIKGVVFETSDYTHIYNKLAQSDILAFAGSSKQCFEYYHEIYENVKKRYSHKARDFLPECWKALHRRGWFNTDVISEDKLLKVLSDCTADPGFTREVLPVLVQLIMAKIDAIPVEERAGLKDKIEPFFNKLVKVTAEYCGPNFEAVAREICGLCKPGVLEKILEFYFQESLNFPDKMSQLTLRVVAEILEQLDEQRNSMTMNEIWSRIDNIGTENMQKFFIKVVGASAFESAKFGWVQSTFARAGKEQAEMDSKLELQFKELLCTRGKVKCDYLNGFRQKKLLTFASAGDILEQYTEFEESSREFVYSSKEDHFNPSALSLEDLPAYEQKVPIAYDPSNFDLRFTNEFSVKAFTRILLPLAQNIEVMGKYFVVYGEDSSEFVRAAIIVDKVMNGENLPLRNELGRLWEECFSEFYPNISKYFQDLWNAQPDTKVQETKGAERAQGVEGAQGAIGTEPSEGKAAEERAEQPPNSDRKAKLQSLKKKRDMFKDKYGKTREKVMQKMEQSGEKERPEEQAEDGLQCIVCKESKQEHNKMYFLAKTKTEKLISSFFQRSLTCDRSFETCLHPMHVGCFITFMDTSSEKPCPLCQSKVNCILPLEAGDPEDDNDEVWRNRIIYVSISETKSYVVEETTLMILKGLVARNGIQQIFLPQKNEFFANTNAHLGSILKFSYAAHSGRALNKLERKVQDMIEGTRKVSKRAAGLVEEVLIRSYWSWLTGTDHREEIGACIRQLSELMVDREFIVVRRQVETILGEQLAVGEPGGGQGEALFSLDAPSSMAELLRLRKHCPKCQSLRGWYCLLCKVTYCYDCDMINEHRNNLHDGNCVVFAIVSGGLRVMSKSSGSEEHKVFRNQFMEDWDSSNSKQARGFRLNNKRYNELIGRWFSSN